MLEDILLFKDSEMVLVRFKKSTEEADILNTISEMLKNYYSQEIMWPLYDNFDGVRIQLEDPAKISR